MRFKNWYGYIYQLTFDVPEKSRLFGKIYFGKRTYSKKTRNLSDDGLDLDYFSSSTVVKSYLTKHPDGRKNLVIDIVDYARSDKELREKEAEIIHKNFSNVNCINMVDGSEGGSLKGEILEKMAKALSCKVSVGDVFGELTVTKIYTVEERKKITEATGTMVEVTCLEGHRYATHCRRFVKCPEAGTCKFCQTWLKNNDRTKFAKTVRKKNILPIGSSYGRWIVDSVSEDLVTYTVHCSQCHGIKKKTRCALMIAKRKNLVFCPKSERTNSHKVNETLKNKNIARWLSKIVDMDIENQDKHSTVRRKVSDFDKLQLIHVVRGGSKGQTPLLCELTQKGKIFLKEHEG